jgi:hypothetical protein
MEGAVMPPPDPPAIKTKQWGQSTSYHHPHPYPTTISIHTLPPSSLPMPCTYNHISIPPFPSQAPISFFHPLPPSPNGPILSPSPHIQPIPHSHLWITPCLPHAPMPSLHSLHIPYHYSLILSYHHNPILSPSPHPIFLLILSSHPPTPILPPSSHPSPHPSLPSSQYWYKAYFHNIITNNFCSISILVHSWYYYLSMLWVWSVDISSHQSVQEAESIE